LEDILAKGLGAENPIKKHHIMETLEKLVNKGYEYKEYLPKSDWSPTSEHWMLKKNNMIVKNEIANHRGRLQLSWKEKNRNIKLSRLNVHFN
jgi:hypothetical protein